MIETAMESGSHFFAWTHQTIDGNVFPATVLLTRVQLGGELGLQATVRDITPEAELEAQLRQAQKMEAIGTLAGGIAHDFNNILSPIMGYVEMALAQVRGDSQLAGDLRQVSIAARRAADLVQQILTFSRQQAQERLPVRVAPIVKEALKLMRASLPATIEMQRNIAATEDLVLADPTQIHQVLVNLCTNAGQAMRETGGVLSVSLENVDVSPECPVQELPAGRYLALSVADTGHGIKPEVVDRIFEPYFTTKEVGEGTGLGLAVAHGIVQGCGGALVVESVRGRGTTFEVFLAVVETLEPVEPAPQAPLPTGQERILLVDDEAPVAKLIARMLEHQGYEVMACTSSKETLDVFQRDPNGFDLVVSDMTMPGLTGIQLATELLRIRPDVPIILCTGFSELVTPESAAAAGIRELLTKPVPRDTLAHAVRRALDGASA